MSKAFCPKCNRGKTKGNWIPIELINEEIKEVKTRCGIKKFLYGNCPKCNSRVTAIIGK